MDWRQFARCTPDDDDILFPVSGQSPARGKGLCRGCSVWEACLESAMVEEDRDPRSRSGIRGGMTATERSRLARARAWAQG